MHALLVCSGSCDFVWYIFLVLFIIAWREFISWVQVQVLFKRISRGWNYKVEGAFGGEK
jgi:hypothetical protein